MEQIPRTNPLGPDGTVRWAAWQRAHVGISARGVDCSDGVMVFLIYRQLSMEPQVLETEVRSEMEQGSRPGHHW